MSSTHALQSPPESNAEGSTLFDSLARLVPQELQTDYYRVLAHTRALSPDDEMLRILEAMGILALLTRHTPKDIADERERIQEMLDLHLRFADESQQKMLQYVHVIEGRLAELPSEIEAGLDPQQVAKILGESLRQHFLQSGLSDTVAGLRATVSAMGNVQKQLVGTLLDLGDPQWGIAAKVESANRKVSDSLERRTKTIESLLHEFKSDLLRIWLPLTASVTLIIGLFAGAEVRGCREPEASTNAVAQTSEHPVSGEPQNSNQIRLPPARAWRVHLGEPECPKSSRLKHPCCRN